MDKAIQNPENVEPLILREKKKRRFPEQILEMIHLKKIGPWVQSDQ
jgi:hypothetical protein